MNNLVKLGTKAAEIAEYVGNPYKELANAITPKNIFGTLLKFSKGEWLAGESTLVVQIGTPMVAIMDHMTCGWIRWEDSRPTNQVMVEVSTGKKPPRRSELGDLEKTNWEFDEKGRPRDPWQFTIYLPMVGHEDGEVYTFATSSKGGINAIGQINGIYGVHWEQHPDQYPIFHLSLDRYQHQNKQYGVIKTPKFEPAGYVNKKDIAKALRAVGLIETPSEVKNSENPGSGMDDEIPF